MPAYFRFLTVMAFNVFLREKVQCLSALNGCHGFSCCFVVWQVDVAIVEVGIGGTYDSTNIIP